MHRTLAFLIGLTIPLTLLGGGAASAASNGVRDEAHFFTKDAIDQADRIIQQIDQRFHKDVLVETLPSIPEELLGQYDPQNRDSFFRQWAERRAQQQGVNGVYILITRDPGRVEVAAGSNTERQAFEQADRNQLARDMLLDFRQRQYDKGLLAGVQFIEQRMNAHVLIARSRTASQSSPPYSPPYYPSRRGDTSWGIGGLACLIVGIVLVVIIIRGIFGRSGSGYYGGAGGYYPPGGNYPPGAYPPGGYGYGGGGGFGRGFLGGLLGGALGGWAVNEWEQRQQGQQGGYIPPAGGGDYSSGVDTSFSATGGDFDASAGGSGGDFGASGSGGGDAGGGGDFGGGGGDSGASTGGDF